MNSPRFPADEVRYFDDTVTPLAFALAYALVGLGLFYSLATDSTRLFGAVLVAIVAVMVLSLAFLVLQEGLLTRENGIISTFVLIAMGLLVGLPEFTALASEVVFGAVVLVGAGVPWLVLRYTGVGDSA